VSGPVFSPRLLAVWIAAALLTFGASLYFGSGGGGPSRADTTGPSAFSRSAIGYAGLVDILRRLGIAVAESRTDPPRPGKGGVLVLAEPPLDARWIEGAARLLQAPKVLLILPKWQGQASRTHKGWIDQATLQPEIAPQFVLGLAVPKARVKRVEKAAAWTTNTLGVAPSLGAPVQLVVSDRLKPLIGSADGMLLGELAEKGRRLWVLADPEALDNHALGKPGNAEFAVALARALLAGAPPGGGLVFDETLHGYAALPASPFLLLFRFPFAIATGLGALALLLLLWATLGRFGAPEPAPPALAAGKSGLIANAAELLDFAGHRRSVARRYVESSLRDAAQRLHAPRELAGTDLLDWLGRLGTARGVSIDCAALARQADSVADAPGLTALARAIHQWKGEIVDGASGDPRARGRAAPRGAQGGRRPG
jgi:Domain of unknown function (DUF4350)